MATTALATFGAAVVAVPVASAAPCDGAPATTATGLDALFSHPIGAWKAGDVPHRYPLPDGRVLWVLNDSFVDTAAPGGPIGATATFVHNVAIVQQGPCVHVLTGPAAVATPGAAPQPASFLAEGETASDWWWFHGGVVVGDELRVVVARMHRDGPVQWGIAFAPVATWIATYDWRTLRLRSLEPAPGPGVPVYGFSLAGDGAWTYLFGQLDELRHPAGSTANTVARVPRGALGAPREYWDGAVWQPDPARAASISTNGTWNHRMRVVFTGERWIGVAKEDEFFGSDVVVFEAPEPQGPWTLTMRVPAPAAIAGETVTYDGEAMVAPVGDHVTIAWSSNTLDFALAAAHPELYRPRFVDVALPPPTNSNPVCAGATVGRAPDDVLASTAVGPRSVYIPLVPARLADTRAAAKSPPPAGTTLAVDVGGSVTSGAPAGTGAVTAAVLNVTATAAAAPGFVTVWPAGQPRPLASNLNMDRAGATAANLVTVAVGPGGLVALESNVAVHLVVDLLAVYRAAPDAVSAGRFTALTPVRLADTRDAGGSRPAAGTTLTVPVLGHGGVPPAGVSAVVLTVTGTDAAADGFVTAWGGGIRPGTSNLNLARGGTRANQAIVPVGPDGAVRVFTQAGAHLVVDVTGWFGDDTAAPATAGRFVPVTPVRLLDSRAGAGRPAGGCTATVALPAGIGTAAGPASAVVANVTTTDTTRPGYVTAWPAGVERPTASNLNADGAGQTRPVHAAVALGSGAFAVYQQHGGHLVVDLAGWYS